MNNNMIFFITILIIFMTFLDPTNGGGCLGGGGGRRRGGGGGGGGGGGRARGRNEFFLWHDRTGERSRPGRFISNPTPSEIVLVEPQKDHNVVVIDDEDRMLDGQSQDNSPDGMQKAKNGIWKKSRLRRKMVKESRMTTKNESGNRRNTTKNVSGKKAVNSTNADDKKE